ncbi:MucR family transcriptional regulator [Methylobacterium persicinum]|uniref:Transcriptional regulator n=1 Tax=Methylobacterium persicinum TaxID=374426 RepID=A0ABU0HIP4_9HYPH|nr:MucR family transcriptional regulator [Methylobacterium persicinum]MDQ0441688.1 putative transcriptional regulator [Methylobacterium persicinum]GJE39449.1 Transcriptional regulatory protein ros [Methylobacterium persicinum]
MTEKPTVELATRILTAYVARNRVPASNLPELLTEIHQAIDHLATPRQPTLQRPSAAQITASIRPDAITSFEDGKPYKALRRHLTLRGLTPETYRAKWGLPVDYPMVCATYSARRSEISREISIGQQQRAKLTLVENPKGAAEPARSTA